MTASGTNIVNTNQTGNMPRIVPARDSQPLASSRTDSQVTFGAPETPDLVPSPESATPSKVTYGDFQKVSQLHNAYPTVFCLPNSEYSEFWCGICDANVDVDAMGTPTKFFDGGIGLYNHIVQEHFDSTNAVDVAAILKRFKWRKISKKDRDLISQGKQPNTTIIMRVPWSGKKAPDDTQPEKRTREVDAEGEGTAKIISLDEPPSKRRRTERTAAITGNQNRQADLNKNPYRNMGSETKKKTPTKRQISTEQANTCESNEEQ